MASVVTNEFKKRLLAEWIAGGADVRARLVMTNTTCDTENDGIVNLSDYTTIDPADASGYADQTLSSEQELKSDANDLGYYDAADVVFSSLGGDASRAYQGVLIYEYVDGTNGNDLACFYVDFSATIPATATQVTVPWDSLGIVQTT